MLVLEREITVGSSVLQHINNVKIKSSWKTLADTATIKVANLKKQLELKIKPGDKVVVKLGYAGYEMQTEFEGYVRSVQPNIPLTIECEDPTWLLRQINLNYNFVDTTLKQVVNYIVKDVKGITLHQNIPDVKLDKFRLANVDGATALNKLKEAYGLVAYFRGHKLFVGLAYTDIPQPGKTNYTTGRNVISTKLEYRSSEDRRIKVKAVGITSDNKKVEKEFGDSDGELRTLYIYGVKDTSIIETKAKEELKRLKYEGYSGSFRTFGIPYVQHGMAADFEDKNYPSRAGSYAVDEVVTEFGMSGFKRDIHLGKKL
jgi:prophage tail gpP-like protein